MTKLSSYSANRWVPCPGSVRLEALFPEEATDPQRADGKASHWALAEILRGQPVAVGQVADNDIALTDEMIDAAEVTADYIQDRRGSSAVELHVEEWADNPVAKAKLDAWFALHEPSTGKLRIVIPDHKYGHQHVDAWDNWQLVSYAWGAVCKLDIQPGADHLVTFDLVISQPRDFHRDGPVRVWTVGLAVLRPMFEQMREAATLAALPDAPCNVGTWCHDCRGRFGCDTITRATRALFDSASAALPLKLPAAALGAELQRVNLALELLRARQSGLEQDAAHTIRNGQRVPGFDLAPSVGKERWKKSDAEIINYGALLGVDVAKPREALTPAQARKAGMPPEQVTRLADRPPGALKLVVDDGRALRRAFGGQP